MVRFLPATLASTLVGASLAAIGSLPVRAQGSLFTAAPVEDSRFILVAAPIGKGESAQLNIYEQRSSKRPCYSVSGSSPAVVNPLLATFDFTGICNRYIDGNGYSLRIGADDFGTRYRLSVVKTGSDVELLAVPTRDASRPTLLIARTGGPGSDFLQLVMEPGWTLMRRQYGKKTLGHLYVYRQSWPGADSGVQSAPQAESAQPQAPIAPTTPANP